jgi:hypothetical protein
MGRRTYTDEQLVDAASTCQTMRDVIATLGLVPRGGNYETVRRRMAVIGLDVPEARKLTRGRPLSDCSKEELAEALRSAQSLAQVLAKLGVAPAGTRPACAISFGRWGWMRLTSWGRDGDEEPPPHQFLLGPWRSCWSTVVTR